MSNQALPDDLLIVLVDDYLNPSTGYSDAERLQTIKNVSLSCKALALGCRRFIFERMKITVGGSFSSAESSPESAAEGLKELFATNLSYFGFVKSLRIESLLMCTIPGDEAPMGDDNADLGDDFYASLEEGERSVSMRYTSSAREEAAICWLLSQRIPNLNSFHFIIRPVNTSQQARLRAVAFTFRSVSSPSWSSNSLAETDPRGKVVALCLPEAIVRFLSMKDRPFKQLTLSSNLPPRTLRYLNGRKPLKYLCLTGFSEVMPLIRSQVEIPFFSGMDEKATATVQDRIEVEELSCDESGGGIQHWVKGPDCAIQLDRVKSLRLRIPADGNYRFPFSECSKSLTSLKLSRPGV